MAELNASYILQGQSPDVVGQLMRGSQAAQQTNQVRQQNALAQLYQTQGAGIMNGDQGALNALAGISPDAAMGIQQNRLGMDQTRLGMQSTRQDMGFQSERMQMARDDAKQKAAEYAKGITAAEAAKHAVEVERGVAAAATATTPGQWDQIAQQFGAPELVGQFANRDAVLGSYMGIAEVMKQRSERPDPLKGAPEGQMFVDANNPGAGLVPIPGYTPKPADDYGRYVQEQQAANLTPMGRIEYAQALKGGGITMTTNPDGTTTTTIGGKGGTPQPGKVNYSPLEVTSVLDSIDAIASDKALPTIIGTVVGGGGNNIDELSTAKRLYYGGDGTALVERIAQLQNTTWLAARDMLKGGGAITDYESKKAEGAMSRLSRAKGLPEFKAALTDLRDAITEGQAKLEAQGKTVAPVAPSSGATTTFTYNPDTGELE